MVTVTPGKGGPPDRERVPISDLAEDLAEILSSELGLSVPDRTGLKGLFDLKLEWTPDESQPRGRETA
jgi:uncharacterized protein (TIGR03435 family)